jgi:hypothetical protein
MADNSGACVEGFFWGFLAAALIAFFLYYFDQRSLASQASGSPKSDPAPIKRFTGCAPSCDDRDVPHYNPGARRRMRQHQPINVAYPFYPRPHRAVRRVPRPCYMPCGPCYMPCDY